MPVFEEQKRRHDTPDSHLVPQLTFAPRARQADLGSIRIQASRAPTLSQSAFLSRPARVQRAVATPVLEASRVRAEHTLALQAEHANLTRLIQRAQAQLPPGAVQAAVQRQDESRHPPELPTVFSPQQRPENAQPNADDYVSLYRYGTHSFARHTAGRSFVSDHEAASFRQLQSAVTNGLVSTYRASVLPSDERSATFGQRLASVQRERDGRAVVRGFLTRVPRGDVPALQRSIHDSQAAHEAQQAQDEQALTLLQRQRHFAHLEADLHAPQHGSSFLARLQAKQGGGAPLPVTVQRQLERGLNADLSRVRVHTDAEAHKLSVSVGAVAFTTGSDIFFQQGRYDPTSPAGLELLAHEVTHTVQQAQGRVTGGGIDPDAGLEQEARQLGAKLASEQPKTTHAKTFASDAWKPAALRPGPHAPGVYTPQAALQRSVEGASDAAYYGPLLPLFRTPDLTIQRGWLGDTWNATGGRVVGAVQDGAQALANTGKELIARGLHVIPGYRELCLVFGKDLVTGTAMQQNPNAILDALAGLVPGPLKEMLRHLRETNAIPKAWAWFGGELGKLDMRALPGEILDAIKSASLDKARAAVTRRVTGMKNLVTGSARKIAEIALDAVGAGFGPAAQQVIAGLKKSGDVILQVLRNPAGFARNLIQAVTGGFKRFATNFKTHASNALGEWLTGNTGLTFPKSLDIQGVFMVVMSVLGLTYQNFRGRLVKQIGADKVQQAEQKVALLQNIKSKGLHATEEMQGSKQGVSKEVKDGVITEVRNNVVQAAVIKLVSMFVPGGGFVQAMLSAFKTVQFLIQEAASIGRLVTSGISSIATGNIAGAITAVEGSLGQGLTLALKFLAKLFGVSGIGTKVRGIIKNVKGRIDQVVGKIMDRAAKLIAKLVDKVSGRGKTPPEQQGGPQTADTSGESPSLSDGPFGQKLRLDGDKEPHHVWAEARNGQPIIMMASTPMNIIDQLRHLKAEAKRTCDPKDFNLVSQGIQAAGRSTGRGIAEMRDHVRSRPRSRQPNATASSMKTRDFTRNPALDAIALRTLERIRADLTPVLPVLARAVKGTPPQVGLHPLSGPNQESHHVPAAELAETIQAQYKEVASRLAGNTVAPVQQLRQALQARAAALNPVVSTRGNDLSAILIHRDTHRECKLGNAVHKVYFAPVIERQIQQDLRPGERRIVMVTTPKGKQERLETNLQGPAWQSFLAAMHRIPHAQVATSGPGLVRVNVEDGTLKDVAQSIHTQLQSAGNGLALQQTVSTIRTQINQTVQQGFREALGNGMSAVRAALAHSTKDGDPAQHAGIMSRLDALATSVWSRQVLGPL